MGLTGQALPQASAMLAFGAQNETLVLPLIWEKRPPVSKGLHCCSLETSTWWEALRDWGCPGNIQDSQSNWNFRPTMNTFFLA